MSNARWQQNGRTDGRVTIFVRMTMNSTSRLHYDENATWYYKPVPKSRAMQKQENPVRYVKQMSPIKHLYQTGNALQM